MQTRKLGAFDASAIGMGAMPLSMGDNVRPDRAQAIATVHAALDAGITLIDTADIYAPSWDAMGHNELIVAEALRQYGDHGHVVVATKGGITRGAGETWGRDGSPAYLRSAVQRSARNLGVEAIDLYQWHRPDHTRDYAEVVGTLRDLRDEGLVRAVGISNANCEQIRIAHEVLGEGGLASVQNEFSPRFRSSLPELELCAERGVAFLPWSPLGGTSHAKDAASAYTAFQQVADAHGVSVHQVVLAWELALGEHVIPIPGASRPASITDSAQAADLHLDADEVARLSSSAPPVD